MASYDAIMIGTGQAGPPLARQLAAAGQRVKARYPVLQRAMHIHPTVAEFAPGLLEDLRDT